MSNDQDIRGGTRGDYSPDAIGEFEVLSSQYDAQYGQASGAIINVLTRSGGNDLHARLSGYYRRRCPDGERSLCADESRHPREGADDLRPVDRQRLPRRADRRRTRLSTSAPSSRRWRDATAVVAVNPATLAALGLPTETSVPQDLREPRAVLKLDFHPTNSQTLTFRFRLDNPKTTNDRRRPGRRGRSRPHFGRRASRLDTQNYDYGLPCTPGSFRRWR